uniref:DUF834 domain-containing protein n=1 Tax=Oryza glumipatula TaxID=40148 RepID=A0A0E0ATQ9_9ORYZ
MEKSAAVAEGDDLGDATTAAADGDDVNSGGAASLAYREEEGGCARIEEERGSGWDSSAGVIMAGEEAAGLVGRSHCGGICVALRLSHCVGAESVESLIADEWMDKIR